MTKRMVNRCGPVAVAALLLCAGGGCDTLTALLQGLFPGGGESPLPIIAADGVRIRIDNQSGLPVIVDGTFTSADKDVRQTERVLTPDPPTSTTEVVWTRAAVISLVARVADDGLLPTSSSKPGDLLAQAEFRQGEDFVGGETLDFIIPPPGGSPDFFDCNSNGVNDPQDIANGTSQDCNSNLVPDECDVAPVPGFAFGGFDSSSLLFPLDGTYTLAMAPNDDGSTSEIPLGFTFNLYGTPQTSVYINNNGNLSFGGSFGEYTSTGFPVSGYPMVAALWADIDTGGAGSVWYKIENNTLIVIWDAVGYYSSHTDRLNTFEIAISDGQNPVLGVGNNVAFSYGDMQWTTGDASKGTDGFGGTPATVGANAGNGTDFIQMGRFDHEGTDYDGPEGNTDGVSFLDGQTFIFRAETGTFNIAPIATGIPTGGMLHLNPNAGDSLDLQIRFLSPEAGQTTSVTISDPDGAEAAGMVITNTPGSFALVDLQWTPDCQNAGSYQLTFTATDSFSPPGVSTTNLTVLVECHSEDCNHNGIPDECDISGGTSQDANSDGIPDECN